MSIPPLPSHLPDDEDNRCANALHSMCIHILRHARQADRKLEIGPERLSILSILTFAGPQSINELARMEQVSAPAISRIVSALVAQKFVLRSRDKRDARVVFVAATNKGKNIIEQGRNQRVKIIAAHLQKLDSIQKRQLHEIANILA